MIDVKKLITGFLVLAVAGGATALLISNIGASSAANGTAIVATVTGQPAAAVDGNAFLPQEAATDPNSGDVAIPDDPDPALTSSTDPNNLTEALTNDYMDSLVSANPNGPTTDDTGNPNLTAPDAATVIAQLESGVTSTANIEIPNWDVEAAEIPVLTIATSSPAAVANYSSAIQGIFNQDFVETNLEAMLSNNSDPSAGLYIEPKIQSALQDIAGIQTPSSVIGFQTSLIKLLVYEKNSLALAESVASSSDPLKTAVILQAEAQKYNTVLGNFQSQFQQASALTGFATLATNEVVPQQSTVVALVDNMLGIKTAKAIFGLGDIDFDPTVFGQMLINYGEDIALQIAKNLIIFTMQKTVLTWIRGSGAPRFIQQWATTLATSYTNAALNALNSQFACVNPAYQAQLKVLLSIPTPNSAGGVCAVQFSKALTGSNLTKFYNNFSSGGFVSYMTIFQPSGNLFGSAIDAQDVSLNAGLQSYAAAQTKAIANQGWKSTAICDDNMDPDTGCRPNDALNSSQMCVPHGGGPVYSPTPGDGDGECADGQEPEDIQPGQVVGQVFNSAVDSGGNLTTAANSIAGLLDAFTTSLLNSIATNLITTVTGNLETIGSTGNGSVGSGQSGQIPISCTPTFQDPSNPFSVTFIGAGGQTITAANPNPTTPSYSWSIQNSLGNVVQTGVGGQFTATLNASGTYVATITDTNQGNGGANTQCNVAVPAPN